MRIADEDAASIGSLHRVPKQGSHVQVSRHLEDVTEVLSRRSAHRDGYVGLGNLFENVFENVFDVLESQGVADNLAEQQLRHITQNHLLLSHECLEENLVDLEIRGPLIADDVVCNRFNKPVVVVVPGALVLQVGVGVGAETFGVV